MIELYLAYATLFVCAQWDENSVDLVLWDFLYLAGVVYIKFSKTSEAAKALEEMNGKVLGNTTGNRPLKVLVASRYSHHFFHWLFFLALHRSHIPLPSPSREINRKHVNFFSPF